MALVTTLAVLPFSLLHYNFLITFCSRKQLTSQPRPTFLSSACMEPSLLWSHRRHNELNRMTLDLFSVFCVGISEPNLKLLICALQVSDVLIT